jgi:hypothetical protein
MKSRDIILANLNHSGTERPGMTFDRGRINDIISGGPGAPAGYEQRRWTEGNKEYYDDTWGNLWVRMVGGSVKGEIYQPILKDWSDLDRLQAPQYDVELSAERMRQGFERDTTGEKFKLAGIGGWVFDNARYLRKMEIYFADMVLYPEQLHRMHALVGSVYETLIHAAAKAGADAVMIGEDLGTQKGLLFSPGMFRQYFKPLYTRLMGLAHDYGLKVFMHSCGMNWRIVDDLIDCGVNCFQFDQPALYDMPALAEKFRQRKVALWSPVDIQKIMPTGDRAYIESEALRLCTLFDGCLITKNYGDLPGIGVLPEWDDWAYDVICRYGHVVPA